MRVTILGEFISFSHGNIIHAEYQSGYKGLPIKGLVKGYLITVWKVIKKELENVRK